MSVRDITADSVLAAVQAGHDDVFKLADHFGVMFISHTLNTTLSKLIEQWPPLLVPADPNPVGEPSRWVVAHLDGVLHVNDLLEQLPHDPEGER